MPSRLTNVVLGNFHQQLSKLILAGGKGSKAARKAAQFLGETEFGLPHSKRITNHGESRIEHCKKYDLGDGLRLVTVETEGSRYWLFIGSHEATDRWLDGHVGRRPVRTSLKGDETVRLIMPKAEEVRSATVTPLEVVRQSGGKRMSKYLPLRELLAGQPNSVNQLSLTFDQIDRALHPDKLPASAATHPAWWSNDNSSTHVQAAAGWLSAGWRMKKADLKTGAVEFRRDQV